MPADAETRSLRRCIRDLAGLAALSAVWIGYDARRLAESLADVAERTLDPCLVFVRMHLPSSDTVFETAWTRSRGKASPGEVRDLGDALSPWLETGSAPPPRAFPLDNPHLRLAVTRIGCSGHGILLAGAERADFPTQSERLLLSVAANQAVVVLQQREGEEARARVLAREQRRARNLQHLAQASLVINSAPSLPALLQAVTASAREILEADRAFTSLTPVGEETPEAPMLSARSPFGTGDEEVWVTAGRGSAAEHADRSARLAGKALHSDPAWRTALREGGRPVQCWLAAPLLGRRGQNLGLIQVADTDAGEFTEEDEAILVQLARLASVAVENTRLYQRTQHAEQRLRVLVNSLNAILWEADPQTSRTTFVSQQAERLLGYPLAAWLEPEFWVNILHPEDREWATARAREATREGRDYDLEYRVRAADGRIVWLHDIAYVIKDTAGRPVQVGGVVVDVTEWKRLEETLAQRVEELAVAGRRKDEFLAMLAHELRNPLAPIRNSVEVLRGLASEDPRVRRAREVVERQVAHMSRLVDDLLDVARITRGRIELRRAELDLNEIVAEAVESVRDAVDGRGHHLSIGLPSEAVRVAGDRTRLVQVIGNLLTNAARYTPRGGRIQLEVERDEDAGTPIVALRCRDDGQGIAPDLLPRIFELFTQAERSLDRSEGGLGIGLTLVREIVEQHGGTVEARSDGPGRGSEFVVRLPALPGSAAGAGAAGPAAAPPGSAGPENGRGRRVLVVDDNQDAASTLGDLLELWGHEVRVAYDGPAALQAAREFHPDVVLLDIGLPQMDGYEVARRLRDQADGGPACLIALTGYGHPEHRAAAAEAGFDHHLVKPVEPARLQRLLAGPRGGQVAP